MTYGVIGDQKMTKSFCFVSIFWNRDVDIKYEMILNFIEGRAYKTITSFFTWSRLEFYWESGKKYFPFLQKIEKQAFLLTKTDKNFFFLLEKHYFALVVFMLISLYLNSIREI